MVSFLDHWVNYRARFLRNKEFVFPDEVWVGDQAAFDIARTELSEVKILRLVKNPYFDELLEEIKGYSNTRGDVRTKYLYVSENISGHAMKRFGDPRYWGYTESDAVRYFLDMISDRRDSQISITIRPHPNEEHGKYDFLIEEYPELNIEITAIDSMVYQIATHHSLVGCNTTAMDVGLLNGNRVHCSIPPGGHPCMLPFPEIMPLCYEF